MNIAQILPEQLMIVISMAAFFISGDTPGQSYAYWKSHLARRMWVI